MPQQGTGRVIDRLHLGLHTEYGDDRHREGGRGSVSMNKALLAYRIPYRLGSHLLKRIREIRRGASGIPSGESEGVLKLCKPRNSSLKRPVLVGPMSSEAHGTNEIDYLLWAQPCICLQLWLRRSTGTVVRVWKTECLPVDP
jgi:hypothetical protein